MRLDRWFKSHYADLPHSRLEKLLRTGQVRVDGGRAKASTRLAAGQSVRVPPLPDVAPASAPATKALSKAERDFLASITLYEDDDLMVLNKPPGLAGAGRHQDRASSRPAVGGLGRRAEDAAPPRASARPRHVGGPRRGQAARGGGEARPRLPDPLGAQDLLGARQGRAASPARQDRRRAGQGEWPGGRPRAQSAARRAGGGAVGGDLLFGGGQGRPDGRLAVAQARHRPPASAPRPYGHPRPPNSRG